jgi:hypothetical protein
MNCLFISRIDFPRMHASIMAPAHYTPPVLRKPS